MGKKLGQYIDVAVGTCAAAFVVKHLRESVKRVIFRGGNYGLVSKIGYGVVTIMAADYVGSLAMNHSKTTRKQIGNIIFKEED